jgi:hypothetical protein
MLRSTHRLPLANHVTHGDYVAGLVVDPASPAIDDFPSRRP